MLFWLFSAKKRYQSLHALLIKRSVHECPIGINVPRLAPGVRCASRKEHNVGVAFVELLIDAAELHQAPLLLHNSTVLGKGTHNVSRSSLPELSSGGILCTALNIQQSMWA
jgi:hypothetical protein